MKSNWSGSLFFFPFFSILVLVLFKLFPITEQDTTSDIAYSDCNILYSVQHSDTAVGVMK